MEKKNFDYFVLLILFKILFFFYPSEVSVLNLENLYQNKSQMFWYILHLNYNLLNSHVLSVKQFNGALILQIHSLLPLFYKTQKSENTGLIQQINFNVFIELSLLFAVFMSTCVSHILCVRYANALNIVLMKLMAQKRLVFFFFFNSTEHACIITHNVLVFYVRACAKNGTGDYFRSKTQLDVQQQRHPA